jgi:hypothetical protein
MPQENPFVTMQKNGKVFDIPRENLVKAKAMGWSEVKSKDDNPVKPSLFDAFSDEVARSWGFDPEKIHRMGQDPTGKEVHPGQEWLEMTREFTKNTGDWMTKTLKDPAHITDPIEGIASGLEKGVGDIWKVLTETDRHDPKLLEKLVRATGGLTGSTGGLAAAIEGPEVAKGAAKLPGRVGTAASEVAKAGGELPKTALREVSNVGKRSVEAEAAKVAKENAAKKAKFEAGEQASKEKLAQQVAAKEKGSIESSKMETAKRSYQDLKDRTAQQAAENLEKASKMEKMALDSEYEDFAAKILGKDKAHPNGTLLTDISDTANAVVDARKNILKGSEPSITQFNSILGRVKDMIETPEGQLRAAPGQTIPADQLRGYVSELNDKIYDSELPGDVREALKSVRDKAQESITKSIEQQFGKSAVKAYKDLNARYNDYMDTWRDRNSGSPLPRIWKILNQPMTVKRGIPVYREIADILTGKKGEKAIGVIARKKDFGADPSIVAKLRQADEKLSSLPKPKKVPTVEPRTPGTFEPKEFDPTSFIREGVRNRMTNVGNWGSAFMLLRMLTDLGKGSMGGAADVGFDIAAMQALKHMLTSPKVLDWVTKEKP